MLFDRGMVSDKQALAGPELQLSPGSSPHRSVPHSLCCPCQLQRTAPASPYITSITAALMFPADAFKSVGEVVL